MRRWRWLFFVVLLSVGLWARVARAHDFAPGVLVLIEQSPGRFDASWTEPVDSLAAPEGVKVTFPAPCVLESHHLDCAGHDLRGVIAFEGMTIRRVQVLVSIQWSDGRTLERLVRGDDPKLEVGSSPGRSASTWIRLGIEHILTGIDHLAFVLGLLLVVGIHRRLIATITAFTVAHSLTLALSVLDVIHVSPLPVEATIAASILLVAREATHQAPTLTRRFPWLVAGIFGLVHGLGFAGALRELGLPRGSTAFALLWFNVGVELGQLAVVALAIVLARAVSRRTSTRRWPALAAAYSLGGLAGWFFVGRAIALFTRR